MPRRPNIIHETTIPVDCHNLSHDVTPPSSEDRKTMTITHRMMKSSRRKQSKPNRVAFLESALENESHALPPSTHGAEQKRDSSPSDRGSPYDLGCDICTSTFPSQADLTEHVQSVHASANKEEVMTAYHRLGQAFKEEVSSKDANANEEKTDGPNQIETTEETDQLNCTQPEEKNMLPKSGRIFHRDAYCELCDREFCSKYFLKTHKASQHGIYESSKDVASTGAGGSVFPGVTPTTDNNVAQDLSKKSIPVQEKPAPSQIPVPLPPELEDYCEICQKHFCNKYYLKKHKLDVHGIKTESPAKQQSAAAAAAQTPSISSQFSAMASVPPMALPQSLTTMSNVMLLNPFISPMALIQTPPLLQPPQVYAGAHQQPFMLLPQQLTQGANPPRPDTTTTAEDGASNLVRSSPPGIANDSLRNIGVLNADAYCETCRKEFCNKYFLKIHKANKHGIVDDVAKKSNDAEQSPTRETPKENNFTLREDDGKAELGEMVKVKSEPFMSEEERFRSLWNFMPGALEQSKLLQTSSTNATMQDMFGNMMLAKMADRVMCDICNKEVCNKYFLRAHRMKIHGIMDDAIDMPLMFPQKLLAPVKPESETPKIVLTQPTPAHQPARIAVETEQTATEKKEHPSNMSTQELVRMGIDPEAYCDICKKEFCSKYFLRTHKLNIHGIRLDKPSGERPRQQNSSSSQLNSMLNFQLHQSTSNGPEQLHWRWKDTTTNNPRVSCHICNKELCNKYFLRTHMLNKHGLYPSDSPRSDTSTPTSQTLSPPSSRAQSQLFAEDLVSRQALPPGNVSPSPPSGTISTISPKVDQVQQNLSQIKEAFNPGHGATTTEDEEEVANQYYSHYSEVCHICDRRFRSQKWLQTHMLNDHNLSLLDADSSQTDDVVMTDSTRGREVCQLCGMVCASQDTLTIHMSQEHESSLQSENPQESLNSDNDLPFYEEGIINSAISASVRLNLKRKYSKSAKHKLYSCSHCDYKTRWLSNIYSHEERKHSSGKEFRKHSCNECFRSFRYEHSLIRHLEMYHQEGKDAQDADGNLKIGQGRVSNANHKQAKKFRCAHCGSRFKTKDDCFTHIRTVHTASSQKTLTNGGSGVRMSSAHNGRSRPFSCQWCDYKSKYLSNLKSHCAIRHKVPGRLVTQSRLRRHLVRRSLKVKDDNAEDSMPLGNSPTKSDQSVIQTEGTPTPFVSSASFIMQSFKIECNSLENGVLLPAIVNLPVQTKVTGSSPMTVVLTPTEN